MSHFSFFTLILFCLGCLIALSHALNNGFSVELIHRDSFKSPFYQPTETKFQRIINVVRRSINRDNHFNNKKISTKNNYVSTLTSDGGEYLMSYSIGTPPFKVNGSMDTGSNFVWLQCKPCNICYNQTSPMFNPAKSSSYKKIPCSSSTCKSMKNISCSHDEDDSCEYTYGYGDGSNSTGDLSLETLTLDFTSGFSVSFPKILIGCGHTNYMPYFSNQSSGVIGFGSGPMSLINQLDAFIGGKFSYCLNGEYDNRSNLSSKLNFGDAAIVSGDNVVSTPIVKCTNEKSYCLTLEAFSVGNKRIRYEGSIREGTNVSTQTMIIDTDTALTILPHQFYSTLESVVAEAVKLEPVQDHTGSFNLCYNTTSKQSKFPIITAHFSDADVKLDSSSTFFTIDEGIKCFTFRPSQYGYALFGNLAQKNFLIGYDLKNNIVSFKPTDCTKY